MALLASCWLIVESFIIPHGSLKWFYLSFYIHPLFLVFCQIFLWLKILQKWLLFLFFPLAVTLRLCLFVFGFFSRASIFLFSFVKPTTVDVFHDVFEPDTPLVTSRDCEIVVSYSSICNNNSVRSGVFEMGNGSEVGSDLDSHEATEQEDDHQNSCVKDSWLNEFLYSDHYNTSMSEYDVDMSESLLSDPDSFCFSFMDQSVDDLKSHESINQELIQESEDSENSSSNSFNHQRFPDILGISQQDNFSPLLNSDFHDSISTTVDSHTSPANALTDHEFLPLKQQLRITSIGDNTDPFYQKYTLRMRFFNLFYHERLHGMNAISNEHSTISNIARTRILWSLECDLEMICVAQSCLLWEALHHQYHKVEALTSSDSSGNMGFHHTVSGKFQEVQILLERFVEDQRRECQRSCSDTHKRLSFQALLLVPDVTGFMVMEEENKSTREEGIKAARILEAITKCITAFWLYIQTDEKKSFWKFNGIWRAHRPVEDPQDLELLYDLSKALHKKTILVKDVQGKSKCWLRSKWKPLQSEDEKRDVVFAMIDMKLVQRLLKMSLISKSHLKWCQEKLNNLDFKQGKVFRGSTTNLFPSS